MKSASMDRKLKLFLRNKYFNKIKPKISIKINKFNKYYNNNKKFKMLVQ